ncbi:MAG TPA: sigma-70 family RNA polymerase sigma factor [Enhygromyxa sp.]|nr:sigma-70 family RNA polymerase sigma factor [Enhygromyxa sp.]
MSGSSQDERLVESALAGLAGARRELAGRLLDVVQREVAFVLRRAVVGQGRDPRQEVRDLVQEVLVSLFEHDGRELRRWDPARGRSLDSFVRLVARRKAARILGQRKGNPWADQPVDPQAIDDDELDAEADALLRQLEQREELGSVLDALYARMSDRDFQLFDLLFVEERDPAEVADALNMTRGAVNAWAYRTRKLARACVLEQNSKTRVIAQLGAGKGAMSHE